MAGAILSSYDWSEKPGQVNGIATNASGVPEAFLYNNGGIAVDYPSSLNDGNWHQVGFTYSGNSLASGVTLYVDGAAVSKTTILDNLGSSSILNSASFQVSGRAGTGNIWRGSSDEVRIYNRALSAEEINRLYRTTAPQDVEPGLVGFWSFNGPDMSGTTAFDRSGKGNNGTLTNGPTVFPGKVGQGLSFNGSSSYVEVASTNAYHNQDFSIAFWVKPPLTQSNVVTTLLDYDHASSPFRNLVVQSEDATTNRNYYLAYWNGSAFEPAGQFGVGKGIQLTPGEWQHLAYTKSGTTVTGYKNGAVAWSPSAAGSANVGYATRALRIGGVVNSALTRYFNGIVDEVRIYNTALSATEVENLYNMGR